MTFEEWHRYPAGFGVIRVLDGQITPSYGYACITDTRRATSGPSELWGCSLLAAADLAARNAHLISGWLDTKDQGLYFHFGMTSDDIWLHSSERLGDLADRIDNLEILAKRWGDLDILKKKLLAGRIRWIISKLQDFDAEMNIMRPKRMGNR
jgi:hypothetical protein